jgi:hypothetical protein
MPVLPLSELTSTQLVELLTYWQGLAPPGAVPMRQDVDPVRIPGLLPAISLVELIGPSRQPRFRLFGTEVVRSFGYDLTGKTLEEAGIAAERTEYWQSIYWQVADTGRPVFGRDRAAIRDFVTFEWAKLPLSTDGAAIDMILCGYDFLR